MKRLIISVLLISAVLFFSNAQTSTRGFSFQGYAIDANGKPLTNTNINVRFSIYRPGYTPDFVEEQDLTTDNYGVFTTIIGKINTADFSKLDFTQYPNYKLKVEVKDAYAVDYNTIYDAEFPAVAVARFAFNGVPVGTIVPFAGPADKVPDGWLLCDGSSYDPAQYPQLFNVIGYSWGNDGGRFRVPDLRGVFLRGVAGTSGRDPDADSRYSAYSGGNTGNNVGSYQNDQFKSHNHGINLTTSTDGAHRHILYFDAGGGGGAVVDYAAKIGAGETVSEQTGVANDGYSHTTSDGAHSHTVSGSSDNTGGSETRPINAYVYFIIKY